MNKISLVDQPLLGAREYTGKNSPDRLKTGTYAATLAKFIRQCDTPLTIGVQGEWGSGKTSILNMIRENIEEEDWSLGVGRGSRSRVGKELFKTIWVNTWEHSLMKSPEECLLSIISEIIESVTEIDGTWNTAQKAKSAFAKLARGAVKVGVTSVVGNRAGEIADDLMSMGNSNPVKELRESLQETVETIVNRKENSASRFIIFIDDLDRLEPEIAVMILELLKNIFNINHCVFVLAIDYQVVVKGLKGKFGEPTEENAWEFRAFFDKIIQVPFMMPMAAYDLKEYIQGLLQDISFFNAQEFKSPQIKDLAKIVKITVGSNPRALKRLGNSLSLIKMHREMVCKSDTKDSNEFVLKQLLLSFVCLQISFPRIYELLIRSPEFYQWDDHFVNRVTGGPHEENKELDQALHRAMQVHEDEFDEEWEQALFKLVWLNKWQRSRLVEASSVLSTIKDSLLRTVSSEKQQEQLLVDALRMTAVTAVASTDEGVFAQNSQNEEDDQVLDIMGFWQTFRAHMDGSKTVFDAPVRDTHSSKILTRKHPEILDERLQFVITPSSTVFFRFESYSGDANENYEFFNFLKKYRNRLEKASGQSVTYKVNPELGKQSIVFSLPTEIPKRLRLEDPGNDENKKAVFNWLREKLPSIEKTLVKAVVEYQSVVDDVDDLHE